MDNGGVESAMGTAYLSSSAPSAAHTETNLRGGGVEISAGMGTAPGEKQSFVKNSFEPTTPEVGIHPSSLSSALDLTSIPVILDANFDKYCNGSVLRSAILNPGFPWKRTRQKTLLSNPQESILQSEESMKEKMKAFELLDALTKSGGLTIDHASLHVIIAAEHAFDKSLINTLIQDNINPISKLEVSALATAATVQG